MTTVVVSALVWKTRREGVLSFSYAPFPVTGRRHYEYRHGQQHQAGTRDIAVGVASSTFSKKESESPPNAGAISNRRCRGTGFPTVLSAGGGLPSLDGLPSDTTSSVSNNGKTAQRSRRGKYPVIELWRHEATGIDESIMNDMDNHRRDEDGHDNDDEVHGGRKVAARDAVAQTALEHLRRVLRLGTEQVDAMQESFPALAEVHPDKLDLRAKLVSLL